MLLGPKTHKFFAVFFSDLLRPTAGWRHTLAVAAPRRRTREPSPVLAAEGGIDMQLDRNQLNRLLRLSDDQLRAVLGKLLAEYGLDAAAFPLASMDMSRLRAVLQTATDEDIARFMSGAGARGQVPPAMRDRINRADRADKEPSGGGGK